MADGLVSIPSVGSPVDCSVLATACSINSLNLCCKACNRHNSVGHKLSLKCYDMLVNIL